jgi:hypothetical protein
MKEGLDFTYVQGMNVIAGPFCYIMPELNAFYCLSTFWHNIIPLYVQAVPDAVKCGISVRTADDVNLVGETVYMLSESETLRLSNQKEH